MDRSLQNALVAVFDTRGQAEAAIDELWHAGFQHEQIGILTGGGAVTQATTATGKIEDDAGTGAVAGAVAGGALGAVAGALVAGLIPGVGPVLAGGILTATLLGGAAGAAAGSYAGPFVALGLSDVEAKNWESELRAGRTLVSVQAGDRSAEAQTILQSHGGHDLTKRDLIGTRSQ